MARDHLTRWQLRMSHVPEKHPRERVVGDRAEGQQRLPAAFLCRGACLWTRDYETLEHFSAEAGGSLCAGPLQEWGKVRTPGFRRDA